MNLSLPVHITSSTPRQVLPASDFVIPGADGPFRRAEFLIFAFNGNRAKQGRRDEVAVNHL